MGLVRKMYRGGKVWVEADDQGRPLDRNGLVQIRYREQDDRTYSARAAEIEDIDAARLKSASRSRNREGGQPAGGSRGRGASAKPRSRARPKAGAPRSGAGSAAADAMPPGTVIAFTDGACYGNPGPAGVGILLEWNGRTKEISRYIGDGTNNIAELTAIRDALAAIRRRQAPVRLFTDSGYAIGVLTLGWKVKENRELVAEIRALMQKFTDLELLKVKGHSGDPRNERADELARDGIDRQQRGE